jgi:hypothetical protein
VCALLYLLYSYLLGEASKIWKVRRKSAGTFFSVVTIPDSLYLNQGGASFFKDMGSL